jgi:hypothetical protein
MGVVNSMTKLTVKTAKTALAQLDANYNASDEHYKAIYALSVEKSGVFVPSTILDKPISKALHKVVLDYAKEEIANAVGGYTAEQLDGGYVYEGNLIEESVTYVYGHYPISDKDAKKTLHSVSVKLGHVIGKLLSQDSVMVVIDDVPLLLNNW